MFHLTFRLVEKNKNIYTVKMSALKSGSFRQLNVYLPNIYFTQHKSSFSYIGYTDREFPSLTNHFFSLLIEANDMSSCSQLISMTLV